MSYYGLNILFLSYRIGRDTDFEIPDLRRLRGELALAPILVILGAARSRLLEGRAK